MLGMLTVIIYKLSKPVSPVFNRSAQRYAIIPPLQNKFVYLHNIGCGSAVFLNRFNTLLSPFTIFVEYRMRLGKVYEQVRLFALDFHYICNTETTYKTGFVSDLFYTNCP